MSRPIYTESTQRVTRGGVLRDAGKLCGNLNQSLHVAFDNIGTYATEYMTGSVDYGKWLGRTRDSKNIAKDDEGTLFLLGFLFEKAEAIKAKKGFRYSGALMSSREHGKCGSTACTSYAGPNNEYFDMPVVLVNEKLLISADMKPMTLEEVRIARELEGMPTIDDRGFVTGENVKRDSYHFLPTGDVEGVKEMERKISSALGVLSSHIIDVQSAELNRFMPLLRRYLRDTGEGEKRLSTNDLLTAAPHVRDAEKGSYIDFSGIAAGAKAVAFGLGRRDRILTPQEVLIAGRETKSDFHPHIPIGIQTKELDRELAARRRAEEQRFTLYTGLFSEYDNRYTISLEPLDDGGLTVRGPQLIGQDTGQPSEELMNFFRDKCKEVPFARPGDWFFKG
jgi:hypothetical protein